MKLISQFQTLFLDAFAHIDSFTIVRIVAHFLVKGMTEEMDA